MKAWSQLRSYLSWPTEALLVGPDTSSSRKWATWALSFVIGLGLGIASCHSVGKAFFTVGENDNPFSAFIGATAVLFIPLVCLAFVLPRIGGPLLVVSSVAITLASFPATGFDLVTTAAAILTLALPMLLVGFGFTWSGLRPNESPRRVA